MEQFLFYFIHWGIPIIICLTIFFNKPYSKYGLVNGFLFNIALLGFLYNWGQWPIAAYLYFKYFLLLIIGISFYLFIIRFQSIRKSFPKGIGRNLKNSLLLIFAVLFGILFSKTFIGRSYEQSVVSLDFPLKDGTYYIASGGSNGVLNNHFGKGSKSQWFALDINQLGDQGRISSGFGFSDNEIHYIFGKPVYAPCDGRVIELENEVPDNLGTNMNVSAQNGRGNFIFLDCDRTVISLVHLKMGSVQMKLGDEVQVGHLLAEVGNSGFSQEPHLHLQAASWDRDSLMVGIPIEFDGERPYRNVLLFR